MVLHRFQDLVDAEQQRVAAEEAACVHVCVYASVVYALLDGCVWVLGIASGSRHVIVE